MKKLVSYLQRVKDWEALGYQLLPEHKEHLVLVGIIAYIAIYVATYIVNKDIIILATYCNVNLIE